MQVKQTTVYILTNKCNGTLYIGVTSFLAKRIYEHKEKTADGFSKKYNSTLRVFYELYATMESAILREKQIKKGSRNNKITLIEIMNPGWKDLCSHVL